VKASRDQVVAQVHRQLSWLRPSLPADRGWCFQLAIVLDMVLRDIGEEVEIHAGDLAWPRVATATSGLWRYRWEGRSAFLSGGLLYHVWNYLPAREEIVDLSVGAFPQLAAGCGLTWTAPLPPRYLWCRQDDLPEGVSYQLRPEALADLQVLHRRWWREVLAERTGRPHKGRTSRKEVATSATSSPQNRGRRGQARPGQDAARSPK
jgi:hypothetical protein